jgi:DNA-binding protein YbaB
LLSLSIDPSIIDPSDKEVLEKMILSTVNGALTQAREKAQAEIAKVTGGMSIPGLF